MIRRSATLVLAVLLVAGAAPLPGQEPAGSQFTILLSNDDGYDAPGLGALAEALRPVATIVVSAPAREQSGVGHGLTLRAPILVNERRQADGATWYAVEGPPATCVRLAVESLLERRPALVISGINRGDNVGTTVYHSGTLAAAREAALVGLPAVAVSLRGDDAAGYTSAAAYVRDLVAQLRAKRLLASGFFLNVNVPDGPPKGARVTRLSMTPRPESFERRSSPGGRLYFWPVWEQLKDDQEGTDVWALVRGYIALTPLRLDVGDTDAIAALRALEVEGTPPGFAR